MLIFRWSHFAIAALLCVAVVLTGCSWFATSQTKIDQERIDELVRQHEQKQKQASAAPTDPTWTEGKRNAGKMDSGELESGESQAQPIGPAPYSEWTLDQTAADALGKIGQPAVGDVAKLLDKQRDVQERRRAAEILGRIGPAAAEAVPALVRSLEDPNPLVRRASARALGEIGPAAAEAVPSLLEILRTESADAANSETNGTNSTTTDSSTTDSEPPTPPTPDTDHPTVEQ